MQSLAIRYIWAWARHQRLAKFLPWKLCDGNQDRGNGAERKRKSDSDGPGNPVHQLHFSESCV